MQGMHFIRVRSPANPEQTHSLLLCTALSVVAAAVCVSVFPLPVVVIGAPAAALVAVANLIAAILIVVVFAAAAAVASLIVAFAAQLVTGLHQLGAPSGTALGGCGTVWPAQLKSVIRLSVFF